MESEKSVRNINIICFDVPYPADYGGAIEEFYKLKALHACGVQIILHCFVYGDRHPQKKLEKYCEQIFYYERKRAIKEVFASIPFIVKTRQHPELLKNLLSNDYPILFDATHTTGFIGHPDLEKRRKVVRVHNIEWIYYNTLFHAAVSLKEQIFYFLEYKKLRVYDDQFIHADALLCLSHMDQIYYHEKFPNKKIQFVPVFHENDKVDCKVGRGDYILYHGNLSILDNYRSVIDLLDNQLKDVKHKIVIAGKSPDSSLVDFVKNKDNVELIANPSHDQMDELIRNAQICFAVASNPSGIKLKLINSMFRARYIFSNESAFEGSGLTEDIVNMNNYDASGLSQLIDEYMQKEFSEVDLQRRKEILAEKYDNIKNAQKVITALFDAPPTP